MEQAGTYHQPYWTLGFSLGLAVALHALLFGALGWLGWSRAPSPVPRSYAVELAAPVLERSPLPIEKPSVIVRPRATPLIEKARLPGRPAMRRIREPNRVQPRVRSRAQQSRRQSRRRAASTIPAPAPTKTASAGPPRSLISPDEDDLMVGHNTAHGDTINPFASTFSPSAPSASHTDDAPSRAVISSAKLPLSPPQVVDSTPPAYPLSARRRQAEGLVRIRAKVNRHGRAVNLQLAQSSGAGDLDRAALETVKRWRFQPGRRGSRVVETWVVIPIRFHLKPAHL